MTEEDIIRGYEKIAFGSIGDAVKLLLWEEISPAKLKKLDLFMVSELKKPKGGGLEMKFFDRLRALQCLENITSSGRDPSGIYEALRAGADAMEARQELLGPEESSDES